jgi:hypothetical protein
VDDGRHRRHQVEDAFAPRVREGFASAPFVEAATDRTWTFCLKQQEPGALDPAGERPQESCSTLSDGRLDPTRGSWGDGHDVIAIDVPVSDSEPRLMPSPLESLMKR